MRASDNSEGGSTDRIAGIKVGNRALLYFLGNFEASRQYAMQAVQIWRSGSVHSYAEEYYTPIVGCLVYVAMSEWHLGEIASCRTVMAKAISLAQELKDANALAYALSWAAGLATLEPNLGEVNRLTSDLIELCTRHNFVHWLVNGAISRGWLCSVSGDAAEGIRWIEQGIRDLRGTGTVLGMPHNLGGKGSSTTSSRSHLRSA